MAIQFASGALKSRDTPQSQWEDAIVAVRVNDVAVQDTTPTGTEHIWVDTDDPGEVVVPTIEDHNVLANAIGIVVDGNKSALGATAGQYVILQNSTITGKDDGLYTAAQTIPANTVIDGTYLTAVSGGGFNGLKDYFDGIVDTFKFVNIGLVTSNNTKKITVSDTAMIALFVMGGQTERNGIIFIFNRSSTHNAYKLISAATAWTVTANGNEYTLTTDTTGYSFAFAVVCDGEIISIT